jgi:hypothetical protein
MRAPIAVILLSVLAVVSMGGTGCTTARSNARLSPGVSGGLAVMGVAVSPGHDDSHGTKRETAGFVAPIGEAFVQYAWTSPEGTGTALQVKVPIVYYLASLEIYRQLSGGDRWSQGGGIEIGLAPSAYYVITRHQGPLYASFTARALAPWLDGGPSPFVAPQFTFGWQRRLDLFALLSYVRALDVGADIEVADRAYTDLRRQWLFAGIGARF